MEWINPREQTPDDNTFVKLIFENGNTKIAKYLENGYPKQSFWLVDSKFFIIKEKVLGWSII